MNTNACIKELLKKNREKNQQFWEKNPLLENFLLERYETEKTKNVFTFENRWAIVDEYMKTFGRVDNKKRSFDKFLRNLDQYHIPNIEIEEPFSSGQNNTGIKHVFKIQNWKISKPLFEYKHETVEKETNENQSVIERILQPVIHKIEQATPNKARMANMTYRVHIYVDILHEKYNDTKLIESTITRDVFVTGYPVMVKSDFCTLKDFGYISSTNPYPMNECLYDEGGYYIVNGTERVLIHQERIKNVAPFVFKKQQNAKNIIVVEMRSISEISSGTPCLLSIRYKMIKVRNEKTLRLKFPYLESKYPLCIIFRALGIITDKEIINMCTHDNDDKELIKLLIPTIIEGSFLTSQKEALLEIANQIPVCQNKSEKEKINHAMGILNKEMLPHIGSDRKSWKNKAFFIGYSTRRLLEVVLGRRSLDNRDHFSNKRIDMDGALNMSLFHNQMQKLLKEWKSTFQKAIFEGKKVEIIPSFKKKSMQQQIEWSFATGNWIVSKSPAHKSGVADVLSRHSLGSTISHTHRGSTPILNERKVLEPRRYTPQKQGHTCPAETPEGASVGLVHNSALLAHVSIGDSSHHIHILLKHYGIVEMENLTPIHLKNFNYVFVNGHWIGMMENGIEIVNILKKKRRCLEINYQTSISYHTQERLISISVDAGRSLRPLLIVENGKIKMPLEMIKKSIRTKNIQGIRQTIFPSFWQLLVMGYIEFLDPEETDTAYIAMFPEQLDIDKNFTHCEIHPLTFYGIIAGSIPFSNHNPASRNAFQSAMGKQAIGKSTLNSVDRMDTLSHVLWYPQKPICTTRTAETMNLNELASGQEVIIAILSEKQYNGDDSITINQGFIDRGGGRSTFYRTYEAEQKLAPKNSKVSECFEKPDPKMLDSQPRGNINHLDNDGMIHIGTRISAFDELIGKTTTILNKENIVSNSNNNINNNKNDISNKKREVTEIKKKDTSIVSRTNEIGVVNNVMIATNENGTKVAKVQIRSTRTPIIGDKFSSRHGQKGVTGMILPQEDLPTVYGTGMPIDIFINPHCIPSRMTIAQLIEILAGIVGAIAGTQINATAFEHLYVNDTPPEMLKKILHQYGLASHGHQRLISGVTGELMESEVFVGICQYQKLRHMVIDKKHARGRGPVNVLTRQATDGRSKEGGLRLGEMEISCLLTIGASKALYERIMPLSDETLVWICKKCQGIAYKNHTYNFLECNKCGRHDDIHPTKIPYTFKLLTQELQSMLCDVQICLKEQP